MLKRRKYTKSWLKDPDEFITTFDRVADFVAHHGRVLTWVVAGMIVAGLAGAWLLHSRQRAQEKLDSALASAYVLYQQAQESDPKDFAAALRAYQGIVQEFPRPERSLMAYLYIGHLYSQMKDFQKAVPMYRKVAETSRSGTVIRETALLGLGYAQEALAQYSQAIDTYKKILELEGASLKGEALLALGRCHEQTNDPQAALTYYSRYLADPSVQAPAEIQEKVERLKALP